MIYLKYFLIFGFFGWIVENIWNIRDNEFRCSPYINLLSQKYCPIPFLPIYAFGGLIIVIIVNNVKSRINRLLLYGLIFNIIEYIGGYIGEEYICKRVSTCAEGNKLWNYNDNPNIKGYIDIKHTLMWFILGFLGESIYIYIEKNKIDNKIIGIIIFILVLIITIYKKNIIRAATSIQK